MRSNIQIPKTCVFCGKAFVARTTVTACCSTKCAQRYYKVKKRAEKVQAALDTELQDRKTPSPAVVATNISGKEFLSKDEACQLVGISRWTLQRMIKKGTIAAGKFGNRTIIRRADLDKLFS